jgi:hypothetical protein
MLPGAEKERAGSGIEFDCPSVGINMAREVQELEDSC